MRTPVITGVLSISELCMRVSNGPTGAVLVPNRRLDSRLAGSVGTCLGLTQEPGSCQAITLCGWQGGIDCPVPGRFLEVGIGSPGERCTLVGSLAAVSKPRNMAYSHVMNIKMWKRAVVHIEGAADSVDAVALRDAIWQASRSVEDPSQWHELMRRMPVGRNVRVRGTAVFIRHDDRRFLVTARHVLHGPTEVAEAYAHQFEREAPPDAPTPWREDNERRTREREESYIHPVVFRVPTLDEALAASSSDDLDQKFLMNLAAGVTWMTPYTYSVPGIDLAIISLDQGSNMGREFADDLEKSGHVPVDWSVVADGPSSDDADVISVGYPGGVSILGQVPRAAGAEHWSSSIFSLPVVSFGRIAMLHDALPFFWADISVYPGNSGGVLVEEDRVIGIVTGQAVTPVEGVDSVVSRIPFARVMRAGLLRDLLDTQLQKDASHREMHG